MENNSLDNENISLAVPLPDENFVLDLDAMPVLQLYETPMMPMLMLPLHLTDNAQKELCTKAMEDKRYVALLAVKDPDKKLIRSNFYSVGVAAMILDIIRLPDQSYSVILHLRGRLKLKKLISVRPHILGNFAVLEDIMPENDEQRLMVSIHLCGKIFTEMLESVNDQETQTLHQAYDKISSPFQKLSYITVNAPISREDKQKILEYDNLLERSVALCSKLHEAQALLNLRIEIQEKTSANISQSQREHFLQQQIRTIQEELGSSVEDEDAAELEARAAKMKWSKAAAANFEKEFRKLDRFNVQNPEYSIQYNYLDLMLSLPWNKMSNKPIDVEHVRKVLDADHYGLEDVKERIIEQVAVLKLRGDMKAPILCLYGPPGVGKTSLGRSIATALNREYARISLGGLHDESEIRGHRRTYIGALPGRIISALKSCKTGNPVIVLDEIDKIGKDFKGDPATALLEVLDPEQNNKFHDNYLDFDYDLSRVMFIATANDLSTISRPLRDRMELVELTGYVVEEKVEIARRHLVRKVLVEHGFTEHEVEFSPEALLKIIQSYTQESGVRLLEKKIAKVVRRIGMLKAMEKKYPRLVTPELVTEYMGPEEVNPDECPTKPQTGIVTGLAWTAVGGEILLIETSMSEGKGDKLTLTGNLGDVMKESATLALQYLKAHPEVAGIDPQIFKTKDIHIHVPEGAVPKDGPSAGITITSALASLLSGRNIRPRLAMTGEMTLRGKVLPVGGIKEKILAAKRSGVTDIILCHENKKDITKIPQIYLEDVTFHYVENINEVLQLTLM